MSDEKITENVQNDAQVEAENVQDDVQDQVEAENVRDDVQDDVKDDVQDDAQDQVEVENVQYQKADFEGNSYYDAWNDFLPTVFDEGELQLQDREPDREKLKKKLASNDKWEAYLLTFYSKTAEEIACKLALTIDDYKKENDFLQDQVHHLQQAIIGRVDMMMTSSDPAIRADAAAFASNNQLDKLVNDDNPMVRAVVAKQFRGKDLDLLVNDQDPVVRCAVAKVGRDQDLDKLVHDDDHSVIREVIKHQRPQDLEYLRTSSEFWIREMVAENGRDVDLDFLVNDDDSIVRRAVAEQGRDKDLDLLVSDSDSFVRLAVLEHGRKQDLDLLVDDPSEEVRIVVAQHGRKKDRKVFKHDPSIDVRMTYAFATDDLDVISDFVHNDQTADFFKKSVHSPGEKKHVSDIAFTVTQTLCQLHDFNDLEYLLTLTSKTSTQIPFTMVEYAAEFEKDEKCAQKLTNLLLDSKKKLVKETVQKYFDSKK